jgi:periplasmic divalent cation tolerance protein
MTQYVQVYTTTDKEDEAERIAAELVERRLAACVQVLGPMRSTYRWKGAVENAREWLCVIKTSRALYPQVEQAVRGMHSYETPEVLAVPIEAASAPYLLWLGGELRES